MSANGIYGSFDYMGKVMDLRLANHTVIASNIANVDTPHYKATELEFDSALRIALNPGSTIQLKNTNPRHLDGMDPKDVSEVTPRSFYTSPSTVGNDRNTVDIDREMMKLSQNNLIYRIATQLVSKKFGDLRNIISEGGK